MKKMNFVWMAALIIALVMVASACKQGDGIPGLPGAKKPSSVQNFPVAAVTTKAQAQDLIRAVNSSYFSSVLTVAKDGAINAARAEKFPGLLGLYSEMLGKTSYSYSLSINDSDKLVTTANSSYYYGDGPAGGVTVATIKGKSSSSWSSNKPYPFYLSPLTSSVDDWTSRTESIDLTFDISTGFYKYTSSWGSVPTINIAGVVTLQVKVDGKETYVTKESLTEDEKITTNGSGSGKMTATLSIHDGAKGGKFVLTAAFDGSSKERSVGQSQRGNISDVEVFDNAGNKICTLDADTFNQLDSILTSVIRSMSY